MCVNNLPRVALDNTQRKRSLVPVSPLATSALWQTLTFFRFNPNIEPSSYLYTSTEWFSDIPTISGYHQFVVPNGIRTDT